MNLESWSSIQLQSISAVWRYRSWRAAGESFDDSLNAFNVLCSPSTAMTVYVEEYPWSTGSEWDTYIVVVVEVEGEVVVVDVVEDSWCSEVISWSEVRVEWEACLPDMEEKSCQSWRNEGKTFMSMYVSCVTVITREERVSELQKDCKRMTSQAE